MTNPKYEWSRNTWRAETVCKRITKSSQTITLQANPDGGERRRKLAIHKELLCFYSRYYRAALQGNFVEAKRDAFDVDDIDNTTLELCITWLYTGTLDCEAYASLIRLYVLADKFDILALRRVVMTVLHEHSLDSDGETCYLPYYSVIKLAYESLPSNSPLLSWLVELYVHHWNPDKDAEEPGDSTEDAPKKFLYDVLKGKSTLVGDPGRQCGCCRNICEYHEHESEKERKATCGTSKPALASADVSVTGVEFDTEDWAHLTPVIEGLTDAQSSR